MTLILRTPMLLLKIYVGRMVGNLDGYDQESLQRPNHGLPRPARLGCLEVRSQGRPDVVKDGYPLLVSLKRSHHPLHTTAA